MKLKSLWKPFNFYFKSLWSFYDNSLRVIFSRTPTLDGSLQEFQMHRGILFDLIDEHWALCKVLYYFGKSILAHLVALVLKYFNLMLCLFLLAIGPIWIPVPMIYQAIQQHRLDRKFRARAAEQRAEI